MSVKEWTEKTGAIGVISKAGRYGGTYAHRDIAMEFGTWISPAFKLYLIKEFQRLKEQENDPLRMEWNVKRTLAKMNYTLQTEAVKDVIIPKSSLPDDKKGIEYANEAEIINLALFGCTSKEWKLANPERALQNLNLRDMASINELAVLSTLESYNADMIRAGKSKSWRLEFLTDKAKRDLSLLGSANFMGAMRLTTTGSLESLPEKKGQSSDLNSKLKSALDNKPKKKQ